MATLEQIAEAIKRADAAGNAEDVKALGAAYRALQAQAPVDPASVQTLNPYDNGAKRLTGGPGVPQQPEGPNLLNSTLATVNGISASVPFLQNVTDAIGGTVAQLGGGKYDEYVNRQKQLREGYASAAPLARVAGEVGGTLAGWNAVGATKLGGEALGMTGKFGQRLGNSVLSSAGLSTLDAFSNGKTGADALTSGAIGGLAGAGGMLAGEGLSYAGGKLAKALTSGAQRKLTAKATIGAPSAEELKATSRAMFKAVDQSGVTVNTNKFGTFVSNLAKQAKADRINPDLDPKAYSAFKELIGALDDVQKNGGALTISDMHTLRQIAQKAATSVEGRDAMFAQRIVDGLDEFVTSSGATVMPANRLGGAGEEAGNALLGAISTWGRARRVGLIEEAIYKASNQASGLENGLRTQFRQLLQNPKTRKLFTKPELQAIEDVVQGNAVSNLTKLLGKFGFGTGQAGNMLGGTIGAGVGTAFGGLPGMLAATAVGTGARKLSEKMTKGAAEQVARAVATPNIPVAAQAPNLLGKAAGPLEILIRGGALAGAN